jgi:methionyl-tRNA formyltransferase
VYPPDKYGITGSSEKTRRDMYKMINEQKKDFRLLFITQDDPFYVRLFFEEYFKIYSSLQDVVAVVIVNAMGKQSVLKLARQMYDFYGIADFLKVGIRYAAYKALARAPGISLLNNSYSLEQLCIRNGIRVIRAANINSPEFLDKLARFDVDLVISVAAPVIFKEPLIKIPKIGCINIHNGMLPRYRGMLPNFWQMYHGESHVGITVHEINSQLDDGRIILQEPVAIETGETLENLIRRTKRIGAHVMNQALGMIRSGNISYRENPATEGSYFSFPTCEDVREFMRRGNRIM